MTKGYILDTNIVSAVLKGDAVLGQRIQGVVSDVFITTIVLGELMFGGALKSSSPTLSARINAFTANFARLGCDEAIAEIWGNRKAALQRSGITIPNNDLWIAAIALHHNMTVVTRDKHFSYVQGLEVVGW